MESREKVVLESADVKDNGVIITFVDGRFAFYSAELLDSVFSQAEELHGTSEDAEADSKANRSR